MQLTGYNSTLASVGRVTKMTSSSSNVGWLALFTFLWGLVVARIPEESSIWVSENTPHHRLQNYMIYLGEWGPCEIPERPEGDSPSVEYYIASRDHIDPTSHVNHIIDSFVNINGKGHSRTDERKRTNRPLKGLTFEPKVGEQTRIIECRDAHNNPIDMSKCLSVEEQHRLPSKVRSCVVPEPCAASDWSDWRATSSPAQYMRTRNLISLPQGSGERCGSLEEFKTVINNASDLTFAWAGGNWGPCVVVADDADIEDRLMLHSEPQEDTEVTSRDATICGGGTQRRDVTCISTADGRAVPDHLCHHLQPIARVQRCEVQCPRDCQMSEWSDWGPCQPIAGCPMSPVEELTTIGFRTRIRRIVVAPARGGAPCGALEATQPCTRFACERWRVGAWGACELPRALADDTDALATVSAPVPITALVSAACGDGVRERTVECVAPWGTPEPEWKCAGAGGVRPAAREPCRRACAGDCVLDAWGSWSPCSRACLGHAPQPPRRFRNRTVIALPKPGGFKCPPPEQMHQSETCNEHACHSYTWLTLPWGPCLQEDENDTANISSERSHWRLRRSALLTETLHTSAEDEEEWANHGYIELGGLKSQGPYNITIMKKLPPRDYIMDNKDIVIWRYESNQSFNFVLNEIKIGYNVTIPITIPTSLEYDDVLKFTNLKSSEGFQVTFGTTALPPKNDKKRHSRSVDDCGTGKQYRDVWCMEDNDRRVKDSLCAPIKKSEVVQKCNLACPQDCILSEWGPWSECPMDCTTEPATQVRRRYVVEGAARGGSACGAREQRRDCAPRRACRRAAPGERALPLSLAPRWAHADWSGCLLPRSVHCGDGYVTRGVWCSSRRHKLPPGACAALRGAGRVPASHARCSVTCLGEARCALSDWSDWSQCPRDCGHVSTRSRRKLEGSGPCPPGVVLHEGRECPCHSYRVQPLGEWSQCIINQHQDTPSENSKDCGHGTRFRAFACVDVDSGQRVDTHLCSQQHLTTPADFSSTENPSIPSSGLLTEACNIPCPVDCQLSRWGVWSPCGGQDNPPKCGIHIQARTRNILVNASYGGRPCGPVMQSQVCVNPCDRYAWVTGPWLPCYLSIGDSNDRTTSKLISETDKGCGTGEQFRNVRCIDKFSGVTVQEPLCDNAIVPDRVQSCQLACPGDCVLSNWSEWSVCQQPCLSSKRRDRTRALLRAGAGNATCGLTVQAEPCIFDLNCFHYAWRNGPWSDCEPLGGSPCGEGIKRRPIYCERSDGRQVDESLCKDKVRPNPAEKFCYVECPIDCQLSDWGEWQKDSCSCGTNDNLSKVEFMTRSRYILTLASTAGRSCPNASHLREKIPCPREPCHSVKATPYSACQLDYPGLSCGYGKRRREIRCVRDTDGVDVPAWYCDMESMPTEESCFVECSSGCRASAWGAWSGCDAEGVRYRKRVSYRPPGPPCAENVLRYEVFEYANCNVTENELNKDLPEWSNYDSEDEQVNTDEQDDYYVHTLDQPEKTYLLFRGKRLPDEHAALIAGLSCATLVALLLVLYALVRYHKQKTVHKV